MHSSCSVLSHAVGKMAAPSLSISQNGAKGINTCQHRLTVDPVTSMMRPSLPVPNEVLPSVVAAALLNMHPFMMISPTLVPEDMSHSYNAPSVPQDTSFKSC
jgi:hypothetical protein